MRDEKKAKKGRSQHPASPAKAVTKVLERAGPKPHPENGWNKDRYPQGSNSEAALENDGKGSGAEEASSPGESRNPGTRKQASKKPAPPAWGDDRPGDDNQDEDQPGFNTLESDQT